MGEFVINLLGWIGFDWAASKVPTRIAVSITAVICAVLVVLIVVSLFVPIRW